MLESEKRHPYFNIRQDINADLRENLVNDFIQYIEENVMELFSPIESGGGFDAYESNASINLNFNITYVDLRSVVGGGSYRKDFDRLAQIKDDREFFSEIISRQKIFTKILEKSKGNFQSLMREVRKLIELHDLTKQHNTWNIVWYTDFVGWYNWEIKVW